jgi:hypothetical protein
MSKLIRYPFSIAALAVGILLGLSLLPGAVTLTSANPLHPASTPVARTPRRVTSTTAQSYVSYIPVVFADLAPTASPTPPAAPSPTAGGTPTSGSSTGDLWLPFDTSATQYPVVPTWGSNVAVDPSGGVHATYSVYSGFTDNNGTVPAFYAYCPALCGTAANWTRISLSNNVVDARLQLTSAGHPRVMLYTTIPNSNPADQIQYQYAACDVSCTNVTNWTITPASPDGVQEIPASRSLYLHTYFRLDPQDNPVFVYGDGRNDQSHNGTFYRTCSSNCTNPSSWSEVQLSSTAIYFPLSLGIAPNGEPRLMWTNTANADTTIGYTECDAANCLNAASWTAPLTLIDLQVASSDANYSMQVDANGNPRVVWFTGTNQNTSTGIPAAQLFYLWCDSNCGANANNWNDTNVPLTAGWGATPQLVLDSTGLPHLSFDTAASGPGYGWCTANCQSASGSWQSEIVEPVSVLYQNYPVVPIYNCTISAWTSGTRTWLALDPSGNLRLGWDPQHFVSGENLDPPYQSCPVSENDINLARLAVASHP